MQGRASFYTFLLPDRRRPWPITTSFPRVERYRFRPQRCMLRQLVTLQVFLGSSNNTNRYVMSLTDFQGCLSRLRLWQVVNKTLIHQHRSMKVYVRDINHAAVQIYVSTTHFRNRARSLYNHNVYIALLPRALRQAKRPNEKVCESKNCTFQPLRNAVETPPSRCTM